MYVPCEHCGFDTEEDCKNCHLGIMEMESDDQVKKRFDSARIERMARFIAAQKHSGVDFWDGKSSGDYSGELSEREKKSYREEAKRFLAIADGKTFAELCEEEE